MMRHLTDTAIADAIGLAKKERKAAPVFHLLRNLSPELAAMLTAEEWEDLDALPVVGGKAADDELNKRYLLAWDRYDELRKKKRTKRIAAMKQLEAEFPELDANKMWEMTAGRVRYLRELRKKLAVLA